ncbi:hypothetical protein KY290_003377 [Solanum tuberosum]|uniref:Uncharacterized protein n=1 Tax=Solanum tuberosum TaxID=4113 RepID=A0ABQ7WV07_SOLTU|nr:hypothetical protein KY284_003539 [Solanum tuberosum]KAH0733526.1 hypothetical protein KY289_004714 [Solanum tuberosum]KAH0767553.1 hypothetical protein KY285_003424 [Solanum tuberosum]KAH0783779.1 hypothetical protein KY290_003377 [Solanum tuberosum]
MDVPWGEREVAHSILQLLVHSIGLIVTEHGGRRASCWKKYGRKLLEASA